MKQTVLADLKQTKNDTLTCKKPKKTNKNKQTIEEPLNTPQPNTEPNQTQIEGNRNCLLRVRRGTEMRQSRFPWAEAVFFSVIYVITPNSKRAKTNQQGFVSDVWDVEFILFYVFFLTQQTEKTHRKTSRGKADGLADGRKHIQRIFGLIHTRSE